MFAVLLPQFLLGFGNQVAFTILFALSMLAVDAAFTGLLWRADGRRRGDATNLWLWFVPALGPLAYFRFDLVPAVLAGGAVLAAIRRPAMAGAADRARRRAEAVAGGDAADLPDPARLTGARCWPGSWSPGC